jgi:nucleoid-associated protein YgaU
MEYQVRRGDTLWDISARYTGDPFTYPDLARKNRIDNPHLIFPGQTIRVPAATESGTEEKKP